MLEWATVVFVASRGYCNNCGAATVGPINSMLCKREGKYAPPRGVVVLPTNETIGMFDIVNVFLVKLAV